MILLPAEIKLAEEWYLQNSSPEMQCFALLDEAYKNEIVVRAYREHKSNPLFHGKVAQVSPSTKYVTPIPEGYQACFANGFIVAIHPNYVPLVWKIGTGIGEGFWRELKFPERG